MRPRLFLVLVGMVLAARPGWAGEGAVGVSPGSTDGALIGDRCPTFSWGAVAGATSYELVVYWLSEEGEEAQPVLSETLPGSVSSWTPSLDRCFEPGGRYAWSVRSLGERAGSQWSAPSLFEVASGPSEAEIEEAFRVVRQYLRSESTRGKGQLEPSPIDGSLVPSRFASGKAPSTTSGSGPEMTAARATRAPVAGDSALQVSGAAVVTTATVAGAVAAIDRECPGALGSGNRYTDCGNGTVRDNNTGLYWLRDASCPDLAGTDAEGRSDWYTAQSAAAVLADGTCDLTDGSLSGDWRQPTIGEFCSRDSPTPKGGFCPEENASDSLIDRSVSSPTVVNARGDAKWSEGDAFVGVQSSVYWSATEFGASGAWFVSLGNGLVTTVSEGGNGFVWPVRGGQ